MFWLFSRLKIVYSMQVIPQRRTLNQGYFFLWLNLEILDKLKQKQFVSSQ